MGIIAISVSLGVLVYFIITYYILSYAKNTNLAVIIHLAVCFLGLMIFSTFRVGIGFDYEMYVEGFYRMSMAGFSELSYIDWEIGFVLLTKVIGFFTTSHTVYLGIISFIILTPVAIFIYFNSKIPWLSTLLYVNLYLFYMSMNFLRQAIALSIILIAWEFIKKQKFIPFLLLVLLASTFHLTAIVMIPFYFIAKTNPTKKIILLYLYGLIFFYISSEGIINLITDVFYSSYQNSIFLSGISTAFIILPLLVFFATLITKDKLMAIISHNRYLIHFVYAYAFIAVLMSRHAIFERFSYYFLIFLIVIIPEIVNAVEKSSFQKYFKEYGEAPVKNKELLNKVFRRYKTIQISLYLSVIVITTVFNIYGLTQGVHGVLG